MSKSNIIFNIIFGDFLNNNKNIINNNKNFIYFCLIDFVENYFFF